jgi:hypothetical protein
MRFGAEVGDHADVDQFTDQFDQRLGDPPVVDAETARAAFDLRASLSASDGQRGALSAFCSRRNEGGHLSCETRQRAFSLEMPRSWPYCE